MTATISGNMLFVATSGAAGGGLQASDNATITGQWTFENQVNLDNGTVLRLHDATDTDWAQFSHDGTDFNTSFVNTGDWNIDNLSGRMAIFGIQAFEANQYVFDTDQSVSAALDDHVLTYDTSSNTIRLEAAAGGAGLAAHPGAFQASTTTYWTSTPTQQPISIELIDPDGNYRLSAGTLVVASAGYYNVNFAAATRLGTNPNQTRTRLTNFTQVNNGTGYVTAPQSRVHTYWRASTGGTGLAGSFVIYCSTSSKLQFMLYSDSSFTASIPSDPADTIVNIFRIAE